MATSVTDRTVLCMCTTSVETYSNSACAELQVAAVLWQLCAGYALWCSPIANGRLQLESGPEDFVVVLSGPAVLVHHCAELCCLRCRCCIVVLPVTAAQTAIPYPGYWKMCPHRHHPSPHFQAAMQPEGYVWQSGPQGTWRQMGAYTGIIPHTPVGLWHLALFGFRVRECMGDR
jgi:hypothetical protein